MTRPEQPAFPVESPQGEVYYGLTIRQYTVIEIAKAIVNNPEGYDLTNKQVARQAIELADELLEEESWG